jgi:hypothetical protein
MRDVGAVACLEATRMWRKTVRASLEKALPDMIRTLETLDWIASMPTIPAASRRLGQSRNIAASRTSFATPTVSLWRMSTSRRRLDTRALWFGLSARGMSRLPCQLLKQRFRFLQIARVETVSEPLVNRSQQFARLLHLALVEMQLRRLARLRQLFVRGRPVFSQVASGQFVIARLRVVTKYDRAANAQSHPLASTFDVLTL